MGLRIGGRKLTQPGDPRVAAQRNLRAAPQSKLDHSQRPTPMSVREILKMGDPRLLRVAKPVQSFDTPELHALVADMFGATYPADGVGLAAPQIEVDLQLVIFGIKKNERYPDAPPVPETVLISTQIAPLSDEEEEGWECCLSVPVLRHVVPRFEQI